MYSISRHEATVRLLICRKKLGCRAYLSKIEDPQSTTNYARERNAGRHMSGYGRPFLRYGEAVDSVRSTFDAYCDSSDCRAGLQEHPGTQRSSSRPTHSSHAIHHRLFG